MFSEFKKNVDDYLKNKKEIATYRVSQQGDLFSVSLLLKVEYWVMFKLTNEIDFYKPIYDLFLKHKPDYSSKIKINIFCKK